jgi:RNA polymerase sigma factor (sigma-70 family)
MLDDAALLRSYADEKSEAAFREFVARHLNFVYATALRQLGGDPHRAAEVSQYVFGVAARRASTLAQHRALKGWLYTVIRNASVNLLRDERVRRAREAAAQAEREMTTPAVEPGQDLRPVIDQALAALTERDRQAVFLRFFDDWGYQEIGDRFAVTADAARLRVERALEKMKTTLSRRGIASTTAALTGILTTQAAIVAPAGLAETVAGAAVTSAAAGGSAGTFLTLMSMTKIQAGVAALVVLLAATIVVRDVARDRATAQRETTARQNLAEVTHRYAELGREVTTLQSGVAAANAQKSPSQTGPVATPARPARAYLTDPEYQRLAIVSSLARRHLEFQRLYRRLGLSADQVEKFENIMTIQDQANLDAAALRDQGRDPQEVFRHSGPEWQRAMQDLIGPDGFAQLQDYLRGMPVRAFVDSLAGPTAAIGEPLTPEQADRLATAALAHDGMYQQGKGTDPGTVDWSAVWPDAGEILSPGQLTTMRTVVDTWLMQKEEQRRLNGQRPSHG